MWYEREILQAVRKIEGDQRANTEALKALADALVRVAEAVPLFVNIDKNLTELLARIPPKPPDVPAELVVTHGEPTKTP